MQKITWHKETVPSRDLPGQPAQGLFVMIIDDSPTVRKIVETCLCREGFEVQSFHDGVEAMRWLHQPASRLPHLVILDVGLPKMDGYEVARRLKGKPQLRIMVIIMLTRRDGLLDRLKGRLAGASMYLTKPFKTQELVAAVEAQLGVPAGHEREGIRRATLRQ